MEQVNQYEALRYGQQSWEFESGESSSTISIAFPLLRRFVCNNHSMNVSLYKFSFNYHSRYHCRLPMSSGPCWSRNKAAGWCGRHGVTKTKGQGSDLIPICKELLRIEDKESTE